MHRREEYLYYEILEESVSEYETKKLLKATWLCDGIGNELLMDLLVPEDGTIADVKAKLRKRLGSEVEHVQKIRVFEVFQDKIHRELGDEFFVETFSEKTNLYAEPVPEEELEIKEGEYTIDSFNFDTDVAKTHSIPFKFLLKPGEKLADAKARLSERTNLRGETFDKIRIAIVPDAPDEPPVYLSDGELRPHARFAGWHCDSFANGVTPQRT
ncbi:hypothetical protein KEM55_009109 [Ascosphaera atra]|nr:hypothetical protein KEM55_009109 [Ascosphaera atra]